MNNKPVEVIGIRYLPSGYMRATCPGCNDELALAGTGLTICSQCGMEIFVTKLEPHASIRLGENSPQDII